MDFVGKIFSDKYFVCKKNSRPPPPKFSQGRGAPHGKLILATTLRAGAGSELQRMGAWSRALTFPTGYSFSVGCTVAARCKYRPTCLAIPFSVPPTVGGP